MKILFLDVETTGTDPVINDIVQVAFILEEDGVVKEEWSSYVKPHNPSAISADALASNKLTVEQIMTFPEPRHVLLEIINFFARHFDPKVRDKFILAGQNVHFDRQFLEKFLYKCGYGKQAYLNLFSYHTFDLMALTHTLKRHGMIPKESNLKLQTLLPFFGVEVVKAHDAMEDIRGTRKLLNLLTEVFIKQPSEFGLSSLNPDCDAFKYLSTLKQKLDF